jgi:hypothetical protein
MRRQTILPIVVLVVVMHAVAMTRGPSDARSVPLATRDAGSSIARDRVILTLKDSAVVSLSLAAADEGSLFGPEGAGEPPEVASGTLTLAQTIAPEPVTKRAEVRRLEPCAAHDCANQVPTAPTSEASGVAFTAPDMAGFAPHDGFSPVHEFNEYQQGGRASLKVGPLLTPNYRDGDLRKSLRSDNDIDGSDTSGAAVSFSFKLN